MSVVNMKHTSAFDVRIDRATRWGNPFVIGRDGTRSEVIEKYRAWLWQEIGAGRVDIQELAELVDRRLGCWCAPAPCHGDVLKRAAVWAFDEMGTAISKVQDEGREAMNALRF